MSNQSKGFMYYHDLIVRCWCNSVYPDFYYMKNFKMVTYFLISVLVLEFQLNRVQQLSMYDCGQFLLHHFMLCRNITTCWFWSWCISKIKFNALWSSSHLYVCKFCSNKHFHFQLKPELFLTVILSTDKMFTYQLVKLLK